MPISILLVDDNEDLLFLLQKQMELEGFNVTTCLYGKNFLAQLSKDKPDVVLLDINMGAVTGIELCEIARRNKKTANIPILLMSGNNDIAEITSAAGANGYIRKPLDIEDMKNRIAAVV